MQTIFVHEICGKTGDEDDKLTILIDEGRLCLSLSQGTNVVYIDRWQALELATELLNVRKYLKVNKDYPTLAPNTVPRLDS